MSKITIKNSTLSLIMKWLLISVTIFLILATLMAIVVFGYAQAHTYKFYSGISINGESLKNYGHAQAIEYWQAKVDDFINQGIKYKFNNQEITIYPTLPATDPDASYNLVSFDVPATIDQAYLAGRKQGYTTNFLQQMEALIFGKNYNIKYYIDLEETENILKNNLGKFTTPKTEAKPKINEDMTIDILPEAAGTNFDYLKILAQTLDRISNLSQEPIYLNLVIEEPEIKKEDIPDITISKLKGLVAEPELKFVYQDQEWLVPNIIFKDWLIFIEEDNNIDLGLDASSSSAYLKKNIAPDVLVEVLDAKFDITNGRVVEFQGSQDGQSLDIDKTLEIITKNFIADKNPEINLAVKEEKAKITTGEINDLGINTIIGTGHSNFSGSPQNRRHNIAVGAETLNGILIKPGEEFSLITTLGDIDKESGYKPELVIKGDETVPEYGGGLCQIGTTMFRAALATGVDITQRRNHSYRVSYYEPAGTDATIYDPYPDFKFINDTPKHILVQTRIEGDDIYFDFWGTKDGRKIEIADPVIYNIKPPGETIYIETDNLDPGEEKCTETAHNGADAYFDYNITYSDGEVFEKRYTSHYIPWPAKCLVGIDPNKIEETASSTEALLE